MMRSYGFKVVSSDPADGKGIPIAVAGQTMIDVQKLLTDIGCMLIRIDLRIQNEIPKQLVKKFDLNLGGTGKGGLSTGPSEGNDAALEYAMRVLCATLDFLGKGAVGTWMTDTFEDDDARAMIAQDLVDLADHLDGYILEYGTGDDVRRFEGLEREKILAYTKNDLPVSAAVGVIVRDEVRRNHWNLTNDRFVVPVSFDKNIVVSDIPRFASSGPVIVIGKVNRNKEGHITSVEKIHGCYSIPNLKFQRIVTKDSDRDLLNPLIAITGYDSERDVWTMTNEELGISISKPSWDECVVAFHEYAMFLFETYVDSGGQFEGEEGEIRDFLLSLLPA
ncbi:hypothetical protein AUP07_0458 [methanogenic archaeon mixed culture ISO4-G1]|nr:hypothetical protein AUP07_0458 [methanogenic archaeon mixed culture ISO4-G1]